MLVWVVNISRFIQTFSGFLGICWTDRNKAPFKQFMDIFQDYKQMFWNILKNFYYYLSLSYSSFAFILNNAILILKRKNLFEDTDKIFENKFYDRKMWWNDALIPLKSWNKFTFRSFFAFFPKNPNLQSSYTSIFFPFYSTLELSLCFKLKLKLKPFSGNDSKFSSWNLSWVSLRENCHNDNSKINLF